MTKREAPVSIEQLQLEREITDESKRKKMSDSSDDGPLARQNLMVQTLQRVNLGKENCDSREMRMWCGKNILHLSKELLKELCADIDNDGDSQQTKCYHIMVSYWWKFHPYASWRELLNQLRRKKQEKLAKTIEEYAEKQLDPTLTPDNVLRVLKKMKKVKIEACCRLWLSPSVINAAKEIPERDFELISHWIRYSPFGSWRELAGMLFHKKEEEALKLAKEYIQRQQEPSLTHENMYKIVYEVMQHSKNLKKDLTFLCRNLNIHCSVLKTVQEKYPNDPSKQTGALCKYFLDHFPDPCWEKVAYALYLQAFYDDYYKPLETLHKNYLKGTSETRRLFKEAMLLGHVVSKIVKVLLIGGPGVGKTSMKANILHETPPENYESTPIATRPVKTYRIDAKNWVELSRDARKQLVLKVIQSCKSSHGSSIAELPIYQHHLTEQKMEVEQSSSRLKQVNATSDTPRKVSTQDEDCTGPEDSMDIDISEENVSTDPVQMGISTADDLIISLGNSSSEPPVERISQVNITDSGGQPQFHDLLPLFVTDTSLYLFVHKLSEELSDHSMVEYTRNGKHIRGPEEALLSNLQICQQCFRVIHSQETTGADKNKEQLSFCNSAPQIMLIGTFKDKVAECDESPDDKEKIFRDLLLPKFQDKVLYREFPKGSSEPKKLIFKVNAKNPGDEDMEVVDLIRQLIAEKCSETSESVKIPKQWYALELILEEMSETSSRDIFSRQECLYECRKLEFNEESFKVALSFLHSLNLIHYFPDVLPEVVFANTQVLLDMVTELVELVYTVRRNGESVAAMPKLLNQPFQRFHDYALVSVNFLEKEYPSKHYVEGHFTTNEMVRLFSHLSVFAKFNDSEYFVPALLKMLDPKKVDQNRVTGPPAIPAMVLTFTNGGPCHGVFCAMIVSLLSPQNPEICAWELEMESDSITPTCLYRNCVKFVIPELKSRSNESKSMYPGFVVLIDAYTHFEVHLHLPEDVCVSGLATEMCPIIKHAVFEAIEQANSALHYVALEDTIINALCPCGVGESPHAAQINKKYKILLCKKDTMECFKFQPLQLIWFEEEITKSGNMEQNQSAVSTDSDIDIDDIPRAYQLQLIEKNGQTLRLINEVASNWEELATALRFESSTIELIERDCHQQGKKACRKMLFRWLDGKALQPVSWRTLIAALRDAQMNSVADDLETIICAPDI